MKSNAALVAVVVTGMASALASGMMVGCDDTSQGVAVFGDGMYIVGRDVKPGTYTNASIQEKCRWNITEGQDVVDWQGEDHPESPSYTIDLDQGQHFFTEGCGSWQRQ